MGISRQAGIGPFVPVFNPTLSTFFDGVNESVNFGNNLDWTGATARSWFLWVKVDFNAQVSRNWLIKDDGNGYRFARVNNTRFRFLVRTAGGNLDFRSAIGALADLTWTSVGLSTNGDTTAAGCNIYINGALSTPVVSADGFSGSSSNSDDFQYGVNEVANFLTISHINKEVTAAEFLSLHDNSVAGNFDPRAVLSASDILAWHKLGDGDNATDTDGFKDSINSIDGSGNNMDSSNLQTDVPP